MHRCDDIIASISCKTGLVVSADWPFLGCCAMCTAAQKGPLCGHENGCPGPVFACNECDDIIALVDEKNRMQIGLESAKWHGPPAVLRACRMQPRKGHCAGMKMAAPARFLHAMNAIVFSHCHVKKTACKSALYRPNGMPPCLGGNICIYGQLNPEGCYAGTSW